MVLKRIPAISMALTAMLMAGSQPAVAVPGEVDLNFTGQVVDNTCNWDTSSFNTYDPDGHQTISANWWARISRDNFTGLGSVGASGVVRLKFSECGQDISTVKIRFSGPTSNALHALDGIQTYDSSGAESDTPDSGLGYQLWDITGTTQLKSDDASDVGMLTATLTPATDTGTGVRYYYVDLQSRVVQTGEQQPLSGYTQGTGTLTIFWH